MKKVDLIENFLLHHNKIQKKTEPLKPRSKPKVTAFDKAFGLDEPLYKEGVYKGAAKDFVKTYGTEFSDAKFLRELGQKLKASEGPTCLPKVWEDLRTTGALVLPRLQQDRWRWKPTGPTRGPSGC